MVVVSYQPLYQIMLSITFYFNINKFLSGEKLNKRIYIILVLTSQKFYSKIGWNFFIISSVKLVFNVFYIFPHSGTCERCGYISSQPVCKACVMLEGLNQGLPKLGIGKPHKVRRLAGLSPHGSGVSSTASSTSNISEASSVAGCGTENTSIRGQHCGAGGDNLSDGACAGAGACGSMGGCRSSGGTGLGLMSGRVTVSATNSVKTPEKAASNQSIDF